MGVLEDKGRARTFYRYLSQVYDTVNAYIWNEAMRDEALTWFDAAADDRVLDVGCGTGFATEGLLRDTEDVVGLDQSVHQLQKAWAKLGKHDPVSFTLGDAERLPFDDDAFDKTWSSGSIEYWPHPSTALAEIKRVTKPGGTVLIVGPNEPHTAIGQSLADAMMLFYDEDEADEMFHDAGFEDVEHRYLGPWYKPDIAIVSIATVPEDEE